jgi:hypothetical protein
MSAFLKISILFTVCCVALSVLGFKEIGPFVSASPPWDFSMRAGVIGIPGGVVLVLTALSLARRKEKSLRTEAPQI